MTMVLMEVMLKTVMLKRLKNSAMTDVMRMIEMMLKMATIKILKNLAAMEVMRMTTSDKMTAVMMTTMLTIMTEDLKAVPYF